MPRSSSEPRNLIRLWICVVFGLALWFSPTPGGLNVAAWHVFAVFAATILSFLLRPLPMGVCVLLGLLTLASTHTLAPDFIQPNGQLIWNSDPTERTIVSFEPPLWDFVQLPPKERAKLALTNSLSGFADSTTWLVVAAFLIAGAVVRSGLGKRLALSLISKLGGTTLGLGYAIAAAELLLGPFVPSNTARGGGIMAPIVNSLSHALGSHADDQPQRAGRYLVLVGSHANLIVAAMFLTGMAANPLVSKAAEDVLKVDFTWGTWLLGSIVPGLLSLALMPLLMRLLARPEAQGDAAREEAKNALTAMGPWSAKQVALSVLLLTMLSLWATASLQAEWLGYAAPTALVAIAGVAAMVALGIEKWSDVTGNAAAWDTLVWLGGLITMANALRDTGFTEWFATAVGGYVTGWPALATALALALVYFYSMYAFSMLTGHILALAGAFFAAGVAAGAPPLLLVPLVAYFSNLCGCLTNYSSGPVVIYFGLGYVPIGQWFRVGFVVSLVHLAIWLGIGLPYWKMLGWW